MEKEINQSESKAIPIAFFDYCLKCIYADNALNEGPCKECLSVSSNNTGVPINFSDTKECSFCKAYKEMMEHIDKINKKYPGWRHILVVRPKIYWRKTEGKYCKIKDEEYPVVKIKYCPKCGRNLSYINNPQ